MQISIEIPDAFSSDEEDFAADNGELEIDDALNRNSVSFLLHIKYQKILAGSVSLADDPEGLWPVDLNDLPVVTEDHVEAQDNVVE